MKEISTYVIIVITVRKITIMYHFVQKVRKNFVGRGTGVQVRAQLGPVDVPR